MTNRTTYAPPVAGQLQYVHPVKLYGYLPSPTASLPAIFDVTPDEYAAISDRLDSRVANLRERQHIATERTQARWAWLTPCRSMRKRRALADAVRAFDEPVIDLVEVFGGLGL